MTLALGRDRLAALLDATGRTRIVAVGDAMLDEYLVGEVERISPEAPVPVVHVRERRYALGGAANVAQNVVATGAACRLIGAAGEDSAGTKLRAMLRDIGVSPDGMIAVERQTTRKTRVVARSQHLVRIDDEAPSALAPADSTRILGALESALGDASALVLEDYNKGVLILPVITNAI